MASKPEFVQYIADQLSDAGAITYRKMFGEYGMYCDGKIFALIATMNCLSKSQKRANKWRPIYRRNRHIKGQNLIFG